MSPSSEAILGYLPHEMIGHSAVDFIHSDDLDNTREEMRAARRGQRTRNFEFAIRPQGRAHREAVVDGGMVRSRYAGISLSAAT